MKNDCLDLVRICRVRQPPAAVVIEINVAHMHTFQHGAFCNGNSFYLFLFRPLLRLLYQMLYRPVNRDLQRLESVSRSPIFAQFSETLNGVSTVRAYNQEVWQLHLYIYVYTFFLSLAVCVTAVLFRLAN